MLATTADLMEMLLRTPEPGATRLRQAWLRLREYDRATADKFASLPISIPQPNKGVRVLKHKLAIEAKMRYGEAKVAAVALGVSRFTFYRWLKTAA